MISVRTTSDLSLTQRIYAANRAATNDSLTKLSTGFRINSGKDDPAGLITSENLRAVLASLDAELRSMQRADHVASTAEGGLTEVSGMLIEARALAVANANSAGLSDGERQANQIQIDSIISTVSRIAGSTTFNGQDLLDGTTVISAGGQDLEIDSANPADVGNVDIDGSSYALIDVRSGGALNTVNGNLEGAVQALDAAISQVATMRGEIGAFQKFTIEPNMQSMAVAYENTAAANSIIRDTDYAKETSNLARSQLLERTSLLAVAIAKDRPRSALDLLA